MNIRKAVLKAIDEKIKSAQINCDIEVNLLRKEKKDSIGRAWAILWTEIGRIRASFVNRKAEVEARHVNSILAKVL